MILEQIPLRFHQDASPDLILSCHDRIETNLRHTFSDGHIKRNYVTMP
jgi:hypothetical protein